MVGGMLCSAGAITAVIHAPFCVRKWVLTQCRNPEKVAIHGTPGVKRHKGAEPKALIVAKS